MAEFLTIAIADIAVPERLRLVEDDHALAIQASIVEHGLLNPITVRRTPDAAKPFALVAGAHRLRAVDLLDDEEQIEAVAIEADEAEAQLVEIEENLFRNELSALDRALFVQTYREVWERKYGKVERGSGGDRKSVDFQRSINSANLAELISSEAEAGFSATTAEKLGLSKRAIERADFIAKRLHADLRRSLRATPEAENQSLLDRLARMEPERQRAIAETFAGSRDIKAAIEASGPERFEDSDKAYNALVSAFSRASKRERMRFLKGHVSKELFWEAHG